MGGHAIVDQADRAAPDLLVPDIAPSPRATACDPPWPPPHGTGVTRTQYQALPFPIESLGPHHVERERARARSYHRVRRTLNRMYPGRGRMLEIGSGLGFLLAGFKADGWRAHGIDPDARQCRYAAERHGVATHAVDLAQAAIPDAAFDLVVHGRGLAAAPPPLAEINRVLRAGGHCVIDIARPSGLAAAREARRRIAEAGFRLIRSHAVSPWPNDLIASVVRSVGGRRRRGGGTGAGGAVVRLCLQKIATLPAAPQQRARASAPSPPLPTWLAEEVAGVVTVETGHPAYGDVRRGHPWRLPDSDGDAPATAAN